VPNVPDTPKPDIGLPSLDVKVMLIVCCAPTATDTRPATEGVATIKSVLPEGPPPTATGLPAGLVPVLPVLPPLTSVPRLLL
jgi:hypothetical protein